MIVKKPEIGTIVTTLVKDELSGKSKVTKMPVEQWIAREIVDKNVVATALIMNTRFYTVEGEDYCLDRGLCKIYDHEFGWFDAEVAEDKRKVSEEIAILNSLREDKSFKDSDEDNTFYEVKIVGVPSKRSESFKQQDLAPVPDNWNMVTVEVRPYVELGWRDYVVANRQWAPGQNTDTLYNMVDAISMCGRTAYVANPLDTPIIDDDKLLVSKMSDKPHEEIFRIVRFSTVGDLISRR